MVALGHFRPFITVTLVYLMLSGLLLESMASSERTLPSEISKANYQLDGRPNKVQSLRGRHQGRKLKCKKRNTPSWSTSPSSPSPTPAPTWTSTSIPPSAPAPTPAQTSTPTSTPTPSTGSGDFNNCTLTPVSEGASETTKKLLCYLETHRFITGQTDLPDVEKVYELSGKKRRPAIVAFDFMRYTGNDGDRSDTDKVIDYYNTRGGLVAFQWHWFCPFGGKFDGESGKKCVPDKQEDKDSFLKNEAIIKDIELVATEVKKMNDAGVPIIFRPLHESNNNYMWWAKSGPEFYINLWKKIFEVFKRVGAKDVLWVFNGMASGQQTELNIWYPGPAYADIVSVDYTSTIKDLAILKAIAETNTTTPKVMATSETFEMPDPEKPDTAPVSFAVNWAFRDCNENEDGKRCNKSWINALNSPKSIDLDIFRSQTSSWYGKK